MGGQNNIYFAYMTLVHCRDGVGDSVGHRGQTLLPNHSILYETRDDRSIRILRPISLSHLIDPFPSHTLHLICERIKHLLGEDLRNRYILICGGLRNEIRNRLHHGVVFRVIVGDPVLERIIIDSGHVPGKRLERAMVGVRMGEKKKMKLRRGTCMEGCVPITFTNRGEG